VFNTWMGDCLRRTGKLSWYMTKTKINSAFYPSGVGKIKYRPVWLQLWQGAFTCVGWQVNTV